jgi:hypothetical protein
MWPVTIKKYMFLQFAFDELDRNFIFWLSLNLKSALCVYDALSQSQKARRVAVTVIRSCEATRAARSGTRIYGCIYD